jgi:hypothetical protein
MAYRLTTTDLSRLNKYFNEFDTTKKAELKVGAGICEVCCTEWLGKLNMIKDLNDKPPQLASPTPPLAPQLVVPSAPKANINTFQSVVTTLTRDISAQQGSFEKINLTTPNPHAHPGSEPVSDIEVITTTVVPSEVKPSTINPQPTNVALEPAAMPALEVVSGGTLQNKDSTIPPTPSKDDISATQSTKKEISTSPMEVVQQHSGHKQESTMMADPNSQVAQVEDAPPVQIDLNADEEE